MPSNLVYHVGRSGALLAHAHDDAPGIAPITTRFKAPSLLLTLYGDALAPREPAPLPMGTWIALANTLGLSARHVRTSVQRLSQGDWLQAQRVGRCSFYSSASMGQRRIAQGEQRIFSPDAATPEPGRWSFVVLGPQLRASTRCNLSRELVWCGFGEIAPGVFAQHGMAPSVELQPLLDAHDAREHVWTLLNVAQGQEPVRPDARTLHPDGHCAQRLLRGWQAFVQRYRVLVDTPLQRDALRAFALRTQLVHEYRRLLQNHPELPFANDDTLLAVRHQARRIFAQLYLALLAPSESFLDQHIPPNNSACPALLHRRIGALRAMLAH